MPQIIYNIIVILIIFSKLSNSIIDIIDERLDARIAGVKCLTVFSQNYFRNRESLTRSKNIVLTHITNNSSPATEIEKYFLIKTNQAATKANFFGNRYQIRIISDSYKIDGVTHVKSDQIIATDYYVIICDCILNLKNMLKNFLRRAAAWNPAAKFLILYNDIEIRNESMLVAEEIFTILLNKYFVKNATIMYAINSTGYEILRLNNFNPKACRSVTIEKFGYCFDGSIPNFYKILKSINKPIDLRNCSYQLCSRVSPPFVEENCSTGIEINMINEMQKHLKFKLSTMCTNEDRGVLENGTWTELLGKLMDQTCDFIIGGFYPDNEVHSDFWVTNPYMTDSHTWFIGLAKKQEPWKGLVMIYNLTTWQSITCIWLITWITWFILGNLLPEKKPFKSLSLTAIYALGVILGSTINDQPKLHCLRIVFISLILFGLNITTIYTSFLISIFSNPRYEHQISTIQEVLDLKIPFGGQLENIDWFEDSENPQDKLLLKHYNHSNYFEPNDENFVSVEKGQKVLLANRMYIQSKHPDIVYGFPDNVFTSPLEIITKKGFSLLYQFNVIIRRFTDSGLFDKINDDFIYNNTILKKIQHQSGTLKSTVVLTTHHLEGAFAVLCFGLSASAIALILEIISKNSWINSFFGLKVDKQSNFKNQILHYQPIRFTPIERRKIIQSGKLK